MGFDPKPRSVTIVTNLGCWVLLTNNENAFSERTVDSVCLCSAQRTNLELCTVTALSGSFGHSWEVGETEGNSPAKAEQYMRGRSSAG